MIRTLGDGGPPVSRIGLGLAALGRPAYITLGHAEQLAGRTSQSDLEAHTHVMLDEAIRLGVRYLDAARSYGLAEAFLATWLTGYDGPRLTIGSKWGYSYVGDWQMDAKVHEVKDHSVGTFRRQHGESTTLLGGAIDVYHIHSVTPSSPALDDHTLLDALAGLRDDGVIVGISTSGPDQATSIRRAIEIERGGDLLFGSIQATWNILEQSAGLALAEACEAGVGVIVKEALANGRLAVDPPPWLTEDNEAASADVVAIAAALAQPWADVVLSGAASLGHLRSNLEAAHLRMEQDRFAEHAEPPDVFWETRSALKWA